MWIDERCERPRIAPGKDKSDDILIVVDVGRSPSFGNQEHRCAELCYVSRGLYVRCEDGTEHFMNMADPCNGRYVTHWMPIPPLPEWERREVVPYE